MSGNKMPDIETNIKIQTNDLNLDSGYLSGPIDKFPDDEDNDKQQPQEADQPKSDKKEEVKEKSCVSVVRAGDSGVITDDISSLTEDVAEINLGAVQPVLAGATCVRPLVTDLPLDLLFQQDDDGDTQLHIAAVHGYEKPVSTLIRVCPDKELLNICNDYGHTALHLAVMSCNAIITRMLVFAGADIGIRDRRGETPLHKATAMSNVKCIQALLEPVKGHQKKITSVLNQKNYNGQACVHVAASLGHLEALRALHSYGADINSRENLGGWTALHIAASRGDARLVQRLQRYDGLQARATDYAGRSARRVARGAAAGLFERHDDSDSDSDTDDDMFDDEAESLFEMLSSQKKSIVA